MTDKKSVFTIILVKVKHNLNKQDMSYEETYSSQAQERITSKLEMH